ncbi:MAG: hypothetical protein J0L58_20175 [Burkholderiales bacterium]|uniref:hypothetical protein n=1 Tax=Inhella sp. TaxID=1921806 RepID=UPI001AD3077E|nr:hypothetical protein [Burkholderiales bacterium]
MKTYRIELQKFKSAANSAQRGTVSLRFDALVLPQKAAGDDEPAREPASVMEMSEADARVLLSLLKKQLADFDGRKPKSRF